MLTMLLQSNSTEGKNYLKLSGLHNHPNANDGTVGVDCSPLAQIVNLGDTCASKPTCCSTNGVSPLSISTLLLDLIVCDRA